MSPVVDGRYVPPPSPLFDDTRDGLVTRIADPIDGRVSRIHLTDRGRSLRDELVPKAVTVNATTLGRLSTSEGRTLRRLLVKLLEGTGDSTSSDRLSNLPESRRKSIPSVTVARLRLPADGSGDRRCNAACLGDGVAQGAWT